MRHKRAKQNRRTLQYFERIANFHPPYYVLLDGPFLATMIKFKLVDVLRERLSTLLSHCTDVRCCVLASTVQELERLHAANASNETIQAALQWCQNSNSTTNCTILSNTTTTSCTSNHNAAIPVSARAGNNDDDATTKTKQTKKKSPEEIPAAAVTVGAAVPPETVEGLSDAAKQLFDYVAHDPRYFVASQDEDLLSSLRQNRHIPVPIIRLSRTVLLLESPNYHHQHNHHQGGSAAPNKGSELTPAEKELVGLIAAQQNQLSSSSSNSSTRRPPQKAKGPNPLSCKAPNNKKRKATVEETTAASVSAKKRTRRKKSSSASSLSSQNDGTNGTPTV
jgi:rRNA-processing protein FCF1